MIERIGKSGAGRLELVRSTAERSASAGKAGDALGARQVSGPSGAVAEMVASGPPVDAGKVAAIRAAIAEGRYPVDPNKIATSMLALDLPSAAGK